MFESTTLDFIGMIVAALLTVMILSYLFGDNKLFRGATHVFVGVAAGYAGAVAWDSVIRPNLVSPIVSQGWGALLDFGMIIPWILVILLLFKISPVTAKVGSIPMALLVGVGAAVVVGGAITGTLLPQSRAAMLSLRMSETTSNLGESSLEHSINALILLVGTLSTLIYFRFTTYAKDDTRQSLGRPMAILRTVGRVFIGITFGAMYAGALMAAIIALAERTQFLGNVISSILGIF
ncbi:MAG: hypothetical protein PVI78_12325 [Anaerolineales bacterium]|jgi:hypothetical protein